MAVNITITGNIFNGSGTAYTGAEVKYQAYFYKVNATSSSSIWSGVRTSILGQYNFNLADSDLLTTAGNAAATDIVIIVFWTGTSTTRNGDCSNMLEWGATELVLTSSDVYVFDVQTKPNYYPDLSWILQSTGFVNTNYSTINNSEDLHSWVFGSIQMNHWYTRYGQIINDLNRIDNTSYWWGDSTSNINLPGTSIGTHQWVLAGYYDVDIVVEDKCSATTSGTDQIQIFYHPPTADIVMSPLNPNPNDTVSFTWSGTDVDDRITSINWVIHDSGTYGNTDTTTTANKNNSVPHSGGIGTDWCGQIGRSGAFTNPGPHLVEIVINWNDGFNAQTVAYNETFTQSKFLGPAVNFVQVPTQAVMASGIKFTNTSTNVGRVGLGLPNCIEYDWRFIDNGVSTDYLDKPFSYELSVIPTSINCQTRLCASYSDGWDTQQTCVTKNVPFATTIIVTDEDCYHNLEIYGTSDDGTVTGYSWTVSSGISDIGPWVEVWSSPVGMDQQKKHIQFCTINWYKVEGFVYGTGATTSDTEILYISEVCPGVESVYNIWNGTGILDIGTDWDHTHDGIEAEYAKYNGTNGLDADLSNGSKIRFGKLDYLSVDIQNYDYLTMMINIKVWQADKSLAIKLSSISGNPGDTINLEDYVDTTTINVWQKIFIPLSDFNIPASILPGHPVYANYLLFSAGGKIHFYLDDVKFSMGTMVPIPICEPDMASEEFGKVSMSGQELKPSMKAINFEIGTGDVILTPFPRPRHLN